MYLIMGLGNPGEEYENTRHNAGRIIVSAFYRAQGFDDLIEDGRTSSLRTDGKLGKEKVVCLLPETFMNKSGSSIKKIISSKKKAEKLIVVHDDVDIALGKFKTSFNKGSGGHKGVESIIRAVKTKEFYRLRVGISKTTPKGKLKKPKGEKMLNFLMAKFKGDEEKILKKITKTTNLELESIIGGKKNLIPQLSKKKKTKITKKTKRPVTKKTKKGRNN